MNSYKGITFAKGYNKSFADFKVEFGSTHIFNEMHPDFRDSELEKAYGIATSKPINKIKSIEAKTIKINNGDPSRTTSQSKEITTE